MVQRKGKAMYGFATNKTIRRIDITSAKNDFGDYDRYIEAHMEEEKHEPVMEDLKQSKLMARKRQLKNHQQPSPDLFEREEVDPRMIKLEKEFNRQFIQGVAVNEDGKQKVIFKYKSNLKIKNKNSQKDKKALDIENK